MKVLKGFLIAILVVVILAGGFLGWLTIVEYNPGPVEPAEVISTAETSKKVKLGDDVNVLSWNIGYAGLGAKEDFFMDGGEKVAPDDVTVMEGYLDNIVKFIHKENPDVAMIQEVDKGSSRTFKYNQTQKFTDKNTAFSPNYRAKFVPFPMPPLGTVDSGLLNVTDFQVEKSERIALPLSFSWPVRTANLKRCLQATYIPIENSDKKLVIVNLHLEAYDSGEGKIKQSKALREFITGEYEKGNYVIAGGDFNQTFPGSKEKYPILNDENWVPGTLEDSFLPDGWNFTYDLSEPTCRLLDKPYDEKTSQKYVIDGFVVSPNVKVNKVENVNLHFENSDHNPVRLNVTLEK